MRRRGLLAAGMAALASPALIRPALIRPALADPGVAEPDGYRMDDYRAPVPETVRGGAVLHLADMREVVRTGGAVLIDVLPAPRRPGDMRPSTPWLPPPHRSLPGSLWWPDVGRGELPPALEEGFHTRLEQVGQGRLVVFFCLDHCWMSWNATRRAAAYGAEAAWFPEGADGWEAAGLPTEVVQPEVLG